ncbi:hypothetical protein [Daejeonella sp.]|uniref:hypothetical protein n=1 Tax=Daejeonella sp. TaxID=2805397 RepID=UPI0030C55C7E
MRTILIIGGIILAGATVIAVVQNDKKADATPEVHQAGDVHEQPVQLPAAPSAAPTLNPAHGLPGHRCDLAVGAPLTNASGAVAPVQNPPVINMTPSQMQPASKAPPSAPAPSASGVKINPAHGMPGHRCDLKVGVPLT